MDNEKKECAPVEGAESEARRDFLKKLGKASATAPAVGLLLAASFKSDRAVGYDGGGSGSGSS